MSGLASTCRQRAPSLLLAALLAPGAVLAQSQQFTNGINNAYNAIGGAPIATPQATCAANCGSAAGTPAAAPAITPQQNQLIQQQMMRQQMLMNGASAVGSQIGNALGQEIGKALFGDPQADAQAQAEAQAQAQAQAQAEAARAEELARQRAQEEATAARLNAELIGSTGGDSSGQLTFMHADAPAAAPLTSPAVPPPAAPPAAPGTRKALEALDCAMDDLYERARSMGIDGRQIADLRAEIADFRRNALTPAGGSGVNDVGLSSLSLDRQYAIGQGAQGQLVVEALVATHGDGLIDVQVNSSVLGSDGRKSNERDAVVFVGADGKAYPVNGISSGIAGCLGH